MIQEGVTYSTTQLRKELNITKYAWENKRDILLEYFKNFFAYDIVKDGRNTGYVIKKIYQEYEPLPKNSIEISKYYAEKTHEVVKDFPYNTGSNVARQIISKNNKYLHKEGTAANYVRPILKSDYTKSVTRRWHKLNKETNIYELVQGEELDYLIKLFKDNNFSSSIEDIVAAYDAGEVEQEDIGKLVFGCYNDILEEFKFKYGYRPMKLCEYIEKNE